MCIQMVNNDCKKLGNIVIREQTRFGRKLSVQRKTNHMSYVITFDI